MPQAQSRATAIHRTVATAIHRTVTAHIHRTVVAHTHRMATMVLSQMLLLSQPLQLHIVQAVALQAALRAMSLKLML